MSRLAGAGSGVAAIAVRRIVPLKPSHLTPKVVESHLALIDLLLRRVRVVDGIEHLVTIPAGVKDGPSQRLRGLPQQLVNRAVQILKADLPSLLMEQFGLRLRSALQSFHRWRLRLFRPLHPDGRLDGLLMELLRQERLDLSVGYERLGHAANLHA